MEIRQISQNGIDFIAQEEGCILHPYYDSVHVVTIGIGSTYYENGSKIKITDPHVTKERAYELFKNVIKNYELTVYSTTRDDINQNQFDALVSLCYNIGVNGFKGSTLLRKINNNPNDPSITEAFKMWRNAGGQPILLGRRIREAKLYFTPVHTNEKVTTSALNVRETPSTQSSVLRVIPKGYVVYPIKEEDGWSFIGDGWVSSKYLK